MAVVRALVSAGASDDDVLFFFRMRPTGIGERMFEHGLDAFERTVAKVRATAPPRREVDLVHVRVLDAQFDRKRWRLLLYVELLDGEHAGRLLILGFTPGPGRREEVRKHMLASLGLPDPPPSLDVYAGREAAVELVAHEGGLQVHHWLPP